MDEAQRLTEEELLELNKELRKLIGNRLKELRQGETRKRVAHRARVSEAVINKIERGETTPSVETIARLCRALNTSLVEFFMFKPRYSGASQIMDRIAVYLAPKPLNQIKLVEQIVKQMDVLNEDETKAE